MTQLTVRKLHPDVIRALRVRAAQAGRSTEAEVREILTAAVANDRANEAFVSHLLAMPTAPEDDTPFPRIDGIPRDVEL